MSLRNPRRSTRGVDVNNTKSDLKLSYSLQKIYRDNRVSPRCRRSELFAASVKFCTFFWELYCDAEGFVFFRSTRSLLPGFDRSKIIVKRYGALGKSPATTVWMIFDDFWNPAIVVLRSRSPISLMRSPVLWRSPAR